MFKARKRNPKQKASLRRKVEEDDDDSENDTQSKDTEAENTAESIARIKKKRKLLTELQYKKGTDAAALLKSRDAPTLEIAETEGGETAIEEAPSGQEGIMERKHKQALEQYVNAQLATVVGDAAPEDKKGMTKEKSNDNQSNNSNLTQEELYRQLAQASERMTGKSSHLQDETTQDGDVGTGGAMLVAGTGLAEVILPVEERLKAVQATQEASTQHGGTNKKSYFGMPHSSVPAPSGASRFQVSAADKHRHYANNSNQHRSQQSQLQQQQHSQQQTEPTPENPKDQERLGFDALRGKASPVAAGDTSHGSRVHNSSSGNNNSNRGNTRASDDKVYGNFLKQHRENQWRGGR